MARIREIARLRAALVFIACYGLTVALARIMGVDLSLVGLAIVGLGVLACVGVGVRRATTGAELGGPRSTQALVLAVVIVAGLGFWSGFAALVALLSAGASVELWVFAGSASLALVGVGVGVGLSRRALEPSPITRLALGLIALALGCVCVAAEVELGAATLALAGLVALALAAGLAGPASVAAIACFARGEARGPWLAASVMSLLVGRGLGLALAERAASSAQVFECCLCLGFVAVAVAVASSPSWRPLRKLARSM